MVGPERPDYTGFFAEGPRRGEVLTMRGRHVRIPLARGVGYIEVLYDYRNFFVFDRQYGVWVSDRFHVDLSTVLLTLIDMAPEDSAKCIISRLVA